MLAVGGADRQGFKQHGEHLPLITDTVVACLVAGRIAALTVMLRALVAVVSVTIASLLAPF